MAGAERARAGPAAAHLRDGRAAPSAGSSPRSTPPRPAFARPGEHRDDATALGSCTVSCAGPGRGRGRAAGHRSRDGEVEQARAADLRAAAVLRGVPARPRLHRGRPTSPPGSAGSARSPTRRAPGSAIEDACGVELDQPLAALRRLLYCGEWISSHALHIYLLHAPDFLGYPDAIALARDHRDVVERGLGLKKAGNAILELVGGRAIHPVNVAGRRLLPGADRGRAAPAGRAAAPRARRRAGHGPAGWPGSSSPTWN